MYLLRKVLGTVALVAAVLLPCFVGAQTREVVSKQVSVGRSEASLELEFADDAQLTIAFEDGEVLIDGEVVGGFEPGDALEVAWRALLGQAVALDDGPLAAALGDWTVPAELSGRLADVARSIDRALEQSLRPSAGRSADGGIAASLSFGSGDQGSLLRLLLNSAGRLGLVEDALEGLGDNVHVHVQEDVRIERDERVSGTVLVLQGDLTIEGEVDGDVVVIGGALELLRGSTVEGDVRLADARLLRNEGEVGGAVIDVLEGERDSESALRDQLREEVRSELRRELRSEIRDVARLRFDDGDGSSLMAPFRSVIQGVGGLFENLIAVLVLGLIGAAVVAFASDNMDAVAETARQSPGRAAMVGIAGTFLLIPVWVLGAVALTVSIIGIPVMIAWVPIFPLAACAAAVLGYLAVARNAGEWLADSEFPWTGWIRKSNPLVTLVGGLVGLSVAFMAANVISIAPFLGFLEVLLMMVGFVVSFMALQIGFGAVILTRAGRRREHWPNDDAREAAWEAAMDIDVEMDATVAEEKDNA